MGQFTIQCLTTYEEFNGIKREWEEFTNHYFPKNYSRTYPWIAAWWKTYHNQNKVNIYIQRDQDGKIISAAPLFFKWENFGGFPVRMLHLLGNGIGTDDFLITHDSNDFVATVFRDICKKKWQVFRMSRVANKVFIDELLESAKKINCKLTMSETVDFFIRLPKSYSEYLQSRTKNFRRNLIKAENRLNSMGAVEYIVLDPYKDAVRVQVTGEEIARTSWQYKAGTSHYAKRDGGNMYSNLALFNHGAGGEDFNLLTLDGKPAAYLFGCKREKCYYAIETAFHEDFRDVSVGRILFCKIFERLINEQVVDIVDFEGAGDYKNDYANSQSSINSVTFYNNSLYATLIHKFRCSRLYVYMKQRI